MKLSPAAIETLACPRCKGELTDFQCRACDAEFPIVNGVPVLINEDNSVFRIGHFVEFRDTTYKSGTSWKRKLRPLIPSISVNLRSRSNIEKFFSTITAESPRVLIIGGATEGSGLDIAAVADRITFVETDVAFGERTNLICDGHDLPFRDQTYDGVIIQFVLEHVLDPSRCVSEIYRVLKRDGVVYADTPFMQQVHAGRYDFVRFSHLGHRRLFRHFDEIESGPSCGPGMALAWSYCFFLQSFFSNQTLGQIAFAFGSFTGFWLKYLDYFLLKKPTAFDAASSYFFIGKRSETVLADKDLIASYRGAIY